MDHLTDCQAVSVSFNVFRPEKDGFYAQLNCRPRSAGKYSARADPIYSEDQRFNQVESARNKHNDKRRNCFEPSSRNRIAANENASSFAPEKQISNDVKPEPVLPAHSSNQADLIRAQI